MSPAQGRPVRANAGAGAWATAGYIAPFVIYVAMIALPLPPEILFPLRFVIVLAVILWLCRPYLSLKPSRTLASAAVGIAVFLIWIGPDVLFGPAYRHFWLFDNPILGHAGSSLPTAAQRNPFFLTVRVLSSIALVPVLEELFWRGWLMRWLIHREFLKVPLGTYQAGAFWIVALLFASEHGPYWDVGLVTGAVYNLWIIRTKNLADCILAHSVTNLALAVYVLSAGQWQYWL
jgi:CAAX prenyl protease-like protein